MFLDSLSVSTTNNKHSCHVGSITGNDCKTSLTLLQRLPSGDNATTLCRRFPLRCNNPRPLSDLGYHPAFQLQELPKYRPLPALRSDCWAAKSTTSSQQNAKETTSNDSIDSGFITSDSPVLSVEELDVVLQLFDRSVMLVWLEQTKRSITDISDWCSEEENFVHLAHFWLSEFPSDRRCSMFEFEYGLIRDKIASGCRRNKPSPEQLTSFLTVILHEFPEGRLSGLADAYVFLEHLEAVAERFKRDSLLAAVTCSLHNQQNYDCLLAVRSYAIVTIWSAILDQYRSGVDSVMVNSKKKSSRPSTARGRLSSSRVQSARPGRPSSASSVSSLESKSLGDEMAANADISSHNRIFDAIRFVKFCFSFSLLFCTLQISCGYHSMVIVMTNKDKH